MTALLIEAKGSVVEVVVVTVVGGGGGAEEGGGASGSRDSVMGTSWLLCDDINGVDSPLLLLLSAVEVRELNPHAMIAGVRGVFVDMLWKVVVDRLWLMSRRSAV